MPDLGEKRDVWIEDDRRGRRVDGIVIEVSRDFLVDVTPQKSSGVAPLAVVLNWTAAIHR